jgi:hypothetical protein
MMYDMMGEWAMSLSGLLVIILLLLGLLRQEVSFFGGMKGVQSVAIPL